MVKILRKSKESYEAQFPKFIVFTGQKLVMLKMEFKCKYTILITKA